MNKNIKLVCDAYTDSEEWRDLLKHGIIMEIENHYDKIISDLSKAIAVEEESIKNYENNTQISSVLSEMALARNEIRRIRENTSYLYGGFMTHLPDDKSDYTKNENRIKELDKRLEVLYERKVKLTGDRDRVLRKLRERKQNARSLRNPNIKYVNLISALIEYRINPEERYVHNLLLNSTEVIESRGYKSDADEYLSIFDLPKYDEIIRIVREIYRKPSNHESSTSFVKALELIKYNSNAYRTGIMEDYDRLYPHNICRDSYDAIDIAEIQNDIMRNGYARCIKLV